MPRGAHSTPPPPSQVAKRAFATHLGKIPRKTVETNGKRAGWPTLFLLIILPVGLANVVRLTLLLFHKRVNRISRGLCPKQSDIGFGQKKPRPMQGAAS